MKVAIDDGHGMETAGKRTPPIPELGGRIIRENEFNSAVKKLLDIELKRCGFETVLLAEGDTDIPLANRVALANKEKVDIVISIHYDAFDGKFDEYDPEGFTVFHHTGSVKGKRLAECVHKYLKEGTKQVDRGIKSANFYILKYTNAPAILIENGFMDNKVEAMRMLDKGFQKEVAREIAQGVCEYFGVDYIPETKYTVQIGSYAILDHAINIQNRLKADGYEAVVTLNGKVIDMPKPTKSKYYKIGDAHIIETTPDNIEIKVLGDTLKENYGINGTFFDTKTAPVTNPESCVFIAMNEGKAISNNAQFNGWNSPPRATLIYHTSGLLGFRKLQNITSIAKTTQWAIGGFMVKPYMDFKNEGMPGSINYKTAHTYIGYDKDQKIYLIVKPNHMIAEIVPLLDQLKITNCIVLDGGGSSQLNHKEGSYKSTRKINTAVLLKEV